MRLICANVQLRKSYARATLRTYALRTYTLRIAQTANMRTHKHTNSVKHKHASNVNTQKITRTKNREHMNKTNKTNKKGQSWVLDYAAGLFIFLIAIVITFGVITNLFTDNQYDLLVQDANRLSESLMSTGYPVDWDSTDLVRIGLLYNDRLSWRKLEALTALTPVELVGALPSDANYFFVIKDKNGAVLAINDKCGLGNTNLPQNTTPLETDWTLAYYSRTTGSDELSGFASAHGADEYEDGEILDLLDNAHKYGMIIIEDPHFDEVLADMVVDGVTDATFREKFRQAAEYGPIMFLTGHLGTPVLGANTTTNASETSTVQNNDDLYFDLADGAELNMTPEYEVQFMPEMGGALGNLDGSSHQQSLALDGSHITAAKWIYEDAQVYWFGQVNGTYTDGGSSEDLYDKISEGLDAAIVRSEQACTVRAEDVAAKHLVKIERVVADRGELRKILLYVWKTS